MYILGYSAYGSHAKREKSVIAHTMNKCRSHCADGTISLIHCAFGPNMPFGTMSYVSTIVREHVSLIHAKRKGNNYCYYYFIDDIRIIMTNIFGSMWLSLSTDRTHSYKRYTLFFSSSVFCMNCSVDANGLVHQLNRKLNEIVCVRLTHIRMRASSHWAWYVLVVMQRHGTKEEMVRIFHFICFHANVHSKLLFVCSSLLRV